MWRNTDVHNFVDWLQQHNTALLRNQRASFCELDLYTTGSSIRAVIAYLEQKDPKPPKPQRQDTPI